MVVAIRRFRKAARCLAQFLSCDPIFRHCCGLNSQSLMKAYLVGGFKHFFYFPQYIQYMGSSFPLTFIFFSMVIAPPTRKHRTDFLFNSPEIGLSRVAFSRHRKGRCPIWRPCRCTRCDAHPASMVHHIYFI